MNTRKALNNGPMQREILDYDSLAGAMADNVMSLRCVIGVATDESFAFSHLRLLPINDVNYYIEFRSSKKKL